MKYFGLLTLLLLLFGVTASAQPSRFTYQGSLKVSGQPANGNFDMTFDIYPSPVGTTSLAQRTVLNVPVVNGVFNVILDFGYDQFTGQNRYLEVAVRPAGTGSYTTLDPRTEFTAAPFSVLSVNSVNAANSTNAQFLGGRTFADFAAVNDPRLSDARAPLPNSPSYIQNGGTVQSNSNFNISGNGTVGGTLSGGTVNAATQFSIGGTRILSNPGTENLFAGIESGSPNITGFGNSFFGFRAGRFISTGQNNSFFGSVAGNSNLTGNNNVFIGREAGYGNTTGSRNSAFGALADVLQSDLVNATAIGANAQVALSNSLVLGSINGVNFATADTNVGIGTTTPNYRLDVRGRMRIQQRAGAAGAIDTAGLWLFQRTPEADRAFIGMESDDSVGFYGNNGGGWGFVMNTQTGNVGVGTTNPLQSLHVNGNEILSTGANSGFKFRNRNSTDPNEDWVWYASSNIARLFSPTGGGDLVTVKTNGVMTIAGLGAAGSTQLCRNASNEISSCSSSIRYKDNVQNFRPGLDLIKKLRPVSFNWKADGKEDLGLVAEEVADAEPLLASKNEKGEVEGVKYDRVGVVLVNAVNEQQLQIDEQRATIERQQRELEAQRGLVRKQQLELEALKQLVCSQNPTAALCVVIKQ